MPPSQLRTPPLLDTDRWGDASLSALLVAQGLTLFVALPLGAGHAAGRLLLDAGHLAFAAVSAVALTRNRMVRVALLGGIALLAVGPSVADSLDARFGLGTLARDEVIALAAFLFNALVTALVIRRVF